jgi:hypothetical protein
LTWQTARGGGGGEGSRSLTVSRVEKDGFRVRSVDIKYLEFSQTAAGDAIIGDLGGLSSTSGGRQYLQVSYHRGRGRV